MGRETHEGALQQHSLHAHQGELQATGCLIACSLEPTRLAGQGKSWPPHKFMRLQIMLQMSDTCERHSYVYGRLRMLLLQWTH